MFRPDNNSRAEASAAPGFEQIEKLVSQLGDDEITALILEAKAHRPDSVAGWIRCALFAERARRDPPGALALLEDPLPLELGPMGLAPGLVLHFPGLG